MYTYSVRQWVNFLWEEDFPCNSQARQHLNSLISKLLTASNGNLLFKDIFQATQLLLSSYRKQYLHERQIHQQEEDAQYLTANHSSFSFAPISPAPLWSERKMLSPTSSNTELIDMKSVDCNLHWNEGEISREARKKFEMLLQSKQASMNRYRSNYRIGHSCILQMCENDYDLLLTRRQSDSHSETKPGLDHPSDHVGGGTVLAHLSRDGSNSSLTTRHTYQTETTNTSAVSHPSQDTSTDNSSRTFKKKHKKAKLFGSRPVRGDNHQKDKDKEDEKESSHLALQILEQECRVIAELSFYYLV
ncbi:hypothetical protein RFI_24247 [Reticulomyxa filosa]|uniref:Uncharacterized protein n=1 Tax=Reticulomyxa filosa TaxID=46433 RepID=X6MHH3_RETFI|nr:hypothetical protein RFI_24247 [Reticulomyxa filosa]|eukprot:ETO13126.1 hypothetical protein RFI_24247 [Reticulomyxa filosa]